MSSKLETQDTPDDEFNDELKPGATLLRDQYVIEQFLNNGGFGITYLAKDSLHRRVVIKECFPEAICSRSNSTVRVRSRTQAQTFRTIVDLFIAEARSIARLSHPNIVSVHQVFEDNDTAYFAMDFVEGNDLLEIIESSDFIEPEVLEKMVVKLLDAIDFIHREGIIHCDIAPDNILLGENDEPVLIDFGAARDIKTTDSRYIGAVRTVKDGYSPQEFYVADAQQYPSSDLYSFAASLYHVMTKELPKNAQTRLSAIAGGEDDPYVPIKGQVTGYSDTFLDAIDHALNVFPKNRFQSAAEWRSMITMTVDSNAVSRPTLAIDNGSIEQQFDEPSTLDTDQLSHSAKRQSRRQSVFPESTFLEDAASIAATVKKGPGNGLYVGVATAALLAMFGVGIFMMSGGDDKETAKIAVAAVPTITPAPAPASAEPESAAPKSDAIANVALFEKSARTQPVFVPNPDSNAAIDAPSSSDSAVQPVAAVAPEQSVASSPTLAPRSPAPALVEAQDVAPISSKGTVDFDVTPQFADPTVIASVEGAVADHLQPGLRILSVNGTPIDSIGDARQIITGTPNFAVGEPIQVTLGIETPETGEKSDLKITLPTFQETILSNGMTFQTTMEDDQWKTVATNGVGQDQSVLQAGDTVVAMMPNNAMIDTKEALVEALETAIESGTTQFSFAVDRNGEMWLATMEFNADS